MGQNVNANRQGGRLCIFDCLKSWKKPWLQRVFSRSRRGSANARADDEGFLSRLFRGGSSSSNNGSSAARPAPGTPASGLSGSGATAAQPGSPYGPLTGSNFGGLTNQTPVTTPPVAAAAAGSAALAQTPHQRGRHERRPALDSARTRPIRRRQPVRHVSPDLRRRNGDRLRRRASPSPGRPEADPGPAAIRRPDQDPRPLRGPSN